MAKAERPSRERYEAIEEVKAPPATWGARLKALGPGIIMSGSVVGSGELIATANFGAKVGFVAMWVIIAWIVLKLFVAMELARHVITTQKTVLEAWGEDVPGPTWLRQGWMFWITLLLIVLVAFTALGGILGSQISFMLAMIPGSSGVAGEVTWIVVFTVVTFLLLASGVYEHVEKATVAMVAIFSFTIVVAVLLLSGTRFAITAGDIGSGLTFQMPAVKEGYLLALSLGGLIGFAPAELIFYSYWCKEKGYAAWTGPYEDTPAWRARAHGWIRTMQADVLLSSAITGLITIAFYLLGAAVLNRLGQAPAGMALAKTLAQQYTELFGAWAAWLYWVGGLFALYSTYFVWTGSASRLFADACDLLGIARIRSAADWQRWLRIWLVGLLLFYIVAYYLIREPVLSITLAGVVGTLLYPFVCLATIVGAYKTPGAAKPAVGTLVMLWLSSLTMTAFAVYNLLKIVGVA
ncbi:MAG: Nramp family divalent metal transporter [Candidatus Rokubacteria bacterium]|nr:Nramp family divalent metal transporter [Candidatus Rokubacteria bacterium]